jgi:hypothetical protein
MSDANFEGGTPMSSTPQTFTNTQTFSAPAEVMMTPEVEVGVVVAETHEEPTKSPRVHEQQLAQRIEQEAFDPDVEKEGIFEKLAKGEYLKDAHDDTQDQNVDRATDQLIEGLIEEHEPVENEPIENELPTKEKDPFTQVNEYIRGRVENDPEYKQKLGEVIQEKIKNGEAIDPEEVEQEATKRFINEKNSEYAKMSLDEKVSYLEQEYADILHENAALKLELEAFKELAKQQQEIMRIMAQALLELAKKLHEEEEEEEKKESLLILLIKLMGMIMLELTKYEPKGFQQPAPSQKEENKSEKKHKARSTPVEYGKVLDFVSRQQEKKNAPSTVPEAEEPVELRPAA